MVTGVERMSNVSPPTLLLALHCTWMSCVFVAAAGAIRRWAERPRVWHVVAVGNGGAMTLYLWHIPAIAVAAFALHAVGLDAYDVNAAGFWGLLAAARGRVRGRHGRGVPAARTARTSPAAVVGRAGPRHRRPVDAAGALMCVAGVALVLLAKNGLSGFAGWAALGSFLAAALVARVSAAVRDREDREDMDVPELGPRTAGRR